MIPARVALALQADGWWLRSDIIWNKPNPMPESATDRPTNSHEHVFLLTKSGTSQFWTHPRKRGTRKAPLPDYVWIHKRTKLIVNYQPVSDRILRKFWIRRNLWIGHDYFYDADAVREGSIVRRPTTFRGGNTYEYTPGKSKGRESVYQEEMAETGRNLRNVWKADNIMARLRKDISNDQKQYVISELLKRGLI